MFRVFWGAVLTKFFTKWSREKIFANRDKFRL